MFSDITRIKKAADFLPLVTAAIVVDLRATPALHNDGIPALLRSWLDQRGLSETKI